MDKIVVMGNGPSLERFDFTKNYSFDTFGMNAAYRYWHKVGWYPTYYACFDHTVVKSHSENIRELIVNSDEYGIKKFFFRESFLECNSDLEGHEKVVIYESVEDDHEVFEDTSITTGTLSVRFAIYMGYNYINLIGVDSDYTEVIDEAEHEGNELEIRKEVEENPNYFFDGYQQPGDRYNVPHGEEIHQRSWEKLAEYIKDRDIRIINCNPESEVRCFEFGNLSKEIFSYQTN